MLLSGKYIKLALIACGLSALLLSGCSYFKKEVKEETPPVSTDTSTTNTNSSSSTDTTTDTTPPVVTTPPVEDTATTTTTDTTATSNGDSYAVVKGDTLYKIAKKFNVSIGTLAKANHLKSPYILRVGQTLTIPSSGK